MKIFNRGNDAKPAAPAAVPATAPAPAAPAAPAMPPAAPPAAAPAPAAAAPAAPDLAVVLDANVKEMSEKIARLASSLETSQQERGSFEAKVEQMEERMRKLSSLTEMISAQYNPFVGEAPTEREQMPRPEVGLASPPEVIEPPAPQAPAAPLLALPEMPPPTAAPPLPEPEVAAPTSGGMAPLALAAPEASPVAMPMPAVEPGPAMHEEPGIYLWACAPGFESSMLLLGWADMLLKTSGSREALLELVNYYHNIGWLGDPARDQLLAYADGLASPPPRESADWRTDVEVHERSLLFVEKLRSVASRRNA